MKRILIITVLIVAASSYAQGQSKGDKRKSLEQELMQLQHDEDEAESKRDLAALDRLLSDDFIFTAPNGAISDKKRLIEDVKNADPEVGQTINYDDVKTHVYGKTAVVNYLLIVKGQDKNGKDYANRYRNTVVWIKQQGHWRMAAIHVSRIRP
jgi:ketosteroid isomerase-like protein